MKLEGDANVPSVDLRESEVNHLRQLLAWMRCEYMLDEHMQRGYLRGASLSVEHGWVTPERAGEIVQDGANQINHVPKYVRQAVKMLTKALREHEKKAGIVDAKPAQQPTNTRYPMGELRDDLGRLPHKIP